MKVLDYIKENGLNALNENLGISIKEYTDTNDEERSVILLDYNQIESPKDHPVVMECRGLILDKETHEVVCRSFDRFFNHGECPELSSFDFKKATFVEKADGSLIRVYWYKGKWEIATRGTAFAQSEVNGFGLTFRELFLRALRITEADFQAHCDKWLFRDTTYIFELSCDENRVVVGYNGDTVTVLGYRCNKTGSMDFVESKYIDSYVNHHWLTEKFERIRVPAYYHFDSMEDVLEYVENIEKHEGVIKEGFVVYSDSRPVCKMKSPLYVKVHYLRTNAKTFKTGSSIILANEQDEYLAYFPQDKDWLNEIELFINNKLTSGQHKLDEIYNELPSEYSQKDFAKLAVSHELKAFIFSAHKNSSDIGTEFYKMPIEKQIATTYKWYKNENGDEND